MLVLCYLAKKRTATTRIVKKYRRVHLESLGYDRNRHDAGLSQTEYYPMAEQVR